MKFYNKKPDSNQRIYRICPCKDKPNDYTQLTSQNCQTECSNFISLGTDDKGVWIDCKYLRIKARKDKIKELKKLSI